MKVFPLLQWCYVEVSGVYQKSRFHHADVPFERVVAGGCSDHNTTGSGTLPSEPPAFQGSTPKGVPNK